MLLQLLLPGLFSLLRYGLPVNYSGLKYWSMPFFHEPLLALHPNLELCLTVVGNPQSVSFIQWQIDCCLGPVRGILDRDLYVPRSSLT